MTMCQRNPDIAKIFLRKQLPPTPPPILALAYVRKCDLRQSTNKVFFRPTIVKAHYKLACESLDPYCFCQWLYLCTPMSASDFWIGYNIRIGYFVQC